MNNTTKPIKAYSYLRFSTPEQMRGDSFRRQTSMAEEYAMRHGLELDDQLTFHDLGVSAYRGRNAEAGRLAEFLEAVRAGVVAPGSFLLVEALDRLSRLTPRKALRVLESIIEEGITVVTLNDGKSYTEKSLDDDPMDLMMAILLFMRANEESATKARRLRAAWEGKRAKINEKPLTSVTPAWLTLDKATGSFRVIEGRGEVVQRIFDMTLAGVGYERIAVTFNTEGIPPFGRADVWHRSYVKKILENPSVTGVLVPHVVEHQEGKTIRKPLDPIPGYYPAVVEEETFQRVQAMRSGNGHPRTKGRATITNLIAGLGKCPCCASSLIRVCKGSRVKAGKPYLVCSRAKLGAGCTYRAVHQEAVEKALIENVGYIVANAPSGAHDLDARMAEVELQIDALDEMIENVLEAIAIRPSAALTTKLRELEDQRDELQQQQKELANQYAAASSPLVEKRLQEMSDALLVDVIDRPRANALLRQVFNGVTVNWKTGNLELEWKHGGEDMTIPFAWPDEARS